MALVFNYNDALSEDEVPDKPRKKPRNNSSGNKNSKKLKGKKKMLKRKRNDAQPKIILGVDLGTTFSGFAYAANVGGLRNEIEIGTGYPDASRHGYKLEKMPSVVAYASENQKQWSKIGGVPRDLFAYEVAPGMKKVAEFKLGLDDNTDLGKHDDELLHSRNRNSSPALPCGKTTVQVTVDFLTYMRRFAYDSISTALTKEVWDKTPLDIYATIPAVWDDLAIDNTRSAFNQAGFIRCRTDRISFISEPEAAGIAGLKRLNDQTPEYLQVGDTVVIVDVGGGTIDAESMRVKADNPLKLDKIGVGEGSKSGATAIDRRFEKYMLTTFAEEFENISQEKRGPLSTFMDSFEREKRAFNGDPNKVIRIQFGPLHLKIKGKGVSAEVWDDEDGEVILLGQHMIEFFGHTVLRTCQIAHSQVDKVIQQTNNPPKLIILAGGLSSSKYLYDQVKQYCKNYLHGIELQRPENAWGAIARGAVEYGLDRNVIISRVARRHYYIVIRRRFYEGIDPEDRAVMCPRNGKRLDGQLTLLLKKGDILRKTPKQHDGHVVAQDLRFDAMKGDWKVYCSDGDKVSTWCDEDGVYAIGSLKIDMTEVSKEFVKKGYSNDNIDPAKNPLGIPVKIIVRGGHSAGAFNVQAVSMRKCVGELTLSLSA